MATFKACVQKERADGFYPVYIRVTHNRKVGYIKTDKVVSKKSVTKSGDIRDNVVLSFATQLIVEYTNRLNRHDISKWTVKEVIDFLEGGDMDVCFSDYARTHIGRIINRNQERNAKNYKLAVNHLERFMGTTKIMFSHLTTNVIRAWIQSLEKTNRAKEMYPTCVRQIFKAALVELNDEERGVVPIKFNPWLKIQIPRSNSSHQIAISAEECREFFNRPLPESPYTLSNPELGRDVAMMILCLGGINTVDLYNMKKENYRDNILCYNRAKTMHARADKAYMEMRVEPFLQPLFEKYLADKDDEYLFIFHKRYCDSDSFGSNVNGGIRKICEDMGMEKKDFYCAYTFRHTWGTIAQNDCDANLYEVAFAMNHTYGLRVTRGYVKLDFSPAWELNAKVIEFVFFSTEPSKQGRAKDLNHKCPEKFRLSPKKMVYGRAYYKGEVLAEVSDIGFSNVDEVIDVLVKKLPSIIPVGCFVQFRIKDCDSGNEGVYVRSKGKGF